MHATGNSRIAVDEEATLAEPHAQARSAAVGAFAAWLAAAHETGTPYFARWGKSPLGQTDAFGQQQDDEAFGTYGLKQNYVRDTPLAQYAPLQSSEYARALDRYKALQQSILAAVVTAPAGLLAYKTVAPAVATVFGGGH